MPYKEERKMLLDYRVHQVVNGLMVTCGTDAVWFWYDENPGVVRFARIPSLKTVALSWGNTPPEVRNTFVKGC